MLELVIPTIVNNTPKMVAGAVATVKNIKSFFNSKEARKNNDEAWRIHEEARENFEDQKELVRISLEVLGKEKIYMLQYPINKFSTLFTQIKNVEFRVNTEFDEVYKIKDMKLNITELKKMSNIAEDIAKSILGGAGTGVLVSFGACGLASTFAVASTGTAISTLSGAAATNATLAFFGGGSLAAGGLGMAGGTAILGGLIAGPALMAMGFIMGNKARANLEDSYSNLAKARKDKEESEAACSLCRAIYRRSYMLTRLLIRLEAMTLPLLYRLENIIKIKGVDYNAYEESEKHSIAALVSTIQSIKAVLDTSLLTKEGALTKESEVVTKSIARKVKIKLG